jgi:hypothetical protein
MVREFAQIVGIVLIVFGIAGLALGEQYLAGLVTSTWERISST